MGLVVFEGRCKVIKRPIKGDDALAHKKTRLGGGSSKCS